MWNAPSPHELAKLPKFYETEDVPAADKIIHMHFFLGGSDWFAAEYDGEDLFFGFVILNNDEANAEWGYFSLSELAAINFLGFEIDRDLYWQPVRAGDVDALRGLI
ncbi:DUF2958 domain-containing protein [Desulfovibrio sp. OttesenSCG-928-G11]|nr:DUF2958 domain-containing protein [Desulfovibrio sp. OttesenSCG-928-G11]